MCTTLSLKYTQVRYSEQAQTVTSKFHVICTGMYRCGNTSHLNICSYQKHRDVIHVKVVDISYLLLSRCARTEEFCVC